MSKKERGPQLNHKPRRAWPRNGLIRLKLPWKHVAEPARKAGFSELAPDPRRQQSWNTYFAKMGQQPHQTDDELHIDGRIRPFAPFA